MKSTKYHKILSETPADVREHVKFCMDVTDRIHALLLKKFNGKQKLLADKMGKSEAEVSQWFSGVQNFTTKTLTKLSVAFGEPIIAVCTDDYECSTFEQVKVPYGRKEVELQITNTGNIRQIEKQHTLSQPIPYKENITDEFIINNSHSSNYC